MTRPATKSKLRRERLAGLESASNLAERRRHSLQSFFELSQELDYSLSVYDFADQALFNFMGHLGTSHSALWLRRAAVADGLVLVRSHGIPESAIQSIGTSIGLLVDRFIRDRRIVLAADFDAVLDAAVVQELRNLGIALLAPILAPDGLLGAVALGHRIGKEPYEPFELDVLHASMEFFAVALQNTLFSQQMQETNRQLRQANENLKELDRAKTEFVGNMQHELRTPVTVMQMYLEAVLEELPPKSEPRESLTIVMRHVHKLKRMIETLLDFSSLSNNNLEVKAERGDIAAALREYYEKRRNGVALEFRDLRLSLDTELSFASFEQSRLVQILDIVVDNAVRFTPEGTQITLRAFHLDEDHGAFVLVEVEDNGPGIQADKLPKLFVPFQQLDGSMTRDVQGLGLGLALANRLASAMGGRLSAASQVGKGTIFTLRLPAA